MLSTRPYLIRAIRDWAMDNGFTPQVLVDAAVDGVSVPSDYIQDDKIVLNIHDRAVGSIQLGTEWITFTARFSGTEYRVEVPVSGVLAIYARENGQGLFFQDNASSVKPPVHKKAEPPSQRRKRPHLKLVQ